MSPKFFAALVAVGLLCSVRQSVGADVAALPERERKQVNEWLAQRAETMVEAHRLERDVKQAWTDSRYTSPEVEALRKRYGELQQELIRTQSDLQKKVEALPEVQAKVKQLEAMREKERALAKKISEKVGE